MAGVNCCAKHPGVPAAWKCQSCGALLCNQCLHTQEVGTKVLRSCSICKGRAESLLAIAQAMQPEKSRNFFRRLPGAFVYPFRGSGIIVLVFGILIFFLVKLAAFSMIFTYAAFVACTGYLWSYMMRIVNSSADGENELPDWPGFTDYWADIIQPYMLLWLTISICFGPMVLYVRVVEFLHGPPTAEAAAALAAGTPVPSAADPVIGLTLFMLGLFYFPMAILGISMFDSVHGLSPTKVLPAIANSIGGYLITCAVMGAIFVVQAFFMFLSMWITIPVLPTLLNGFISFYFLIVEVRILGLLYFCYGRRYKWFDRK